MISLPPRKHRVDLIYGEIDRDVTIHNTYMGFEIKMDPTRLW